MKTIFYLFLSKNKVVTKNKNNKTYNNNKEI